MSCKTEERGGKGGRYIRKGSGKKKTDWERKKTTKLPDRDEAGRDFEKKENREGGKVKRK